MALEMGSPIEWTFRSECQIPADVTSMLIQGERPVAAYQTIRDIAIFTNLRLIVRDSQGLTGKKVETYSLPWTAVNMWSSENAGMMDLNSEIELWTRAGHLKIRLGKGVDIHKIDSLIAACALAH